MSLFHTSTRRISVLVACFLLAAAGRCGPVALSSGGSGPTLTIDPATLAASLRDSASSTTFVLSHAQPACGDIGGLVVTTDTARWIDSRRSVAVTARVDASEAVVDFAALSTGTLVWPVVKPTTATGAFLLPLSMGSLVPADSEVWQNHLASASPLVMTEGLSMPFVSILEGGRTLTWIFENEFHNEVDFSRADDGLLSASVTHTFTPAAWRGPYRVRVALGPPDPVEPARLFRRGLIESGRLVTLAKKAGQTSGVEKLLGAPHAYFWGAEPVGVSDVTDWRGLLGDLRDASTDTLHRARRHVDAMTAPERADLAALLAEQYPSRYGKRQLMAALNRQLRAAGDAATSESVRQRLVREAGAGLSAAFPSRFLPVEQRGGVLSPRSIAKIRKKGIDRLWIGLPSWQEGVDHPEGVAAAVDAGFLIGPYDSYHSIHRTGQADTWETAQFDDALFEAGAITRADGTPRKGFKQVGRLLSPLAARPAVEGRISRLMGQAPFNSWFFDCDAAGQNFDNDSPRFPHTQQEDLAARLDRMGWAARTLGLVVGSEGGASCAAPAIAFAHGLMTPVIAWGDKEMYEDRKSPYYLGRYYPPDAPERFFKQVPLKPEYAAVHLDARHRIPLFPVALGDSVVVTHQWGYASRKFADQWRTVRLTELLYAEPPLEHVSDDSLDSWLEGFIAYYRVWSPLHRAVAFTPMTEFRILTDDRMVQQTAFGTVARVTVNFGPSPWTDLPPMSARIESPTSGTATVYTVGQP